MAAAGRARIPAFLMALMVCCGANAGALSPFAPTGIIANGLMARIGIPDAQWSNYLGLLLSQAFVGFGGYFLLGGARLLREGGGQLDAEAGQEPAGFDWRPSCSSRSTSPSAPSSARR
jgi:hypothetical protein